MGIRHLTRSLALAAAASCYVAANAVPAPSGPSYDYVISSNADWAGIPSGLLSGGGTVGVNPGNYSAQTLTMRPSATLTFIATNPANLPILNNFVLFDAANLDFVGMDMVSALWDGTGTPAVGMKSATGGPGIGNINFDVFKVRGNYRGNINFAFDPAKRDYPEYANLALQFDTSTGAVTGFLNDGSTSLYVGDLVADGNHAVTCVNLSGGGAGSNVTFTSTPNVEMIVSGGYITGLNIISGGTMTTDHGGGIAGLNADVATLGKITFWPGKNAMVNYLAQGFGVITGAGLKSEQLCSGPVTLTNGEFRLLGNSVKFSSGNRMVIRGNLFDTIYMDSIAMKQYFGASSMEVTNNFFVNIFCKQGHPGDPHPDVISQLWTPTGTTTTGFPSNIYIGNVFAIGFGNSEDDNGQGQGLFWQWLSSTAAHGYGGMVVGNIVLTRRSGNAIDIDHLEELIVFSNILTHYNPAEGGASIQRLDLGGVQVTGENFAGLNIAEKITFGTSGSGSINQHYPNLAIGLNGTSLSGGLITALFPNFYANDRNTLAELETALSKAAGYSAYNMPAGMIDYAGKSFDVSKLPVCVNFTTLVEQGASSAVNSGWKKVYGYPGATVNFSASVGTIEYANNSGGTGASLPASSGSFTLNSSGNAWIRASHTTASGGSSPVTQTVSLNGWDWPFTSVTAVQSAYTRVNAGTTVYAKAVNPADASGFTGLLLAARVKINSHFNGARLFAAETSVRSRVSIDGANIATATLRHGIIHSSTHVANFTGGFNTNWMTILSMIDFTKTVNDDIVRCVVNNSRRPLAGSGNTIDTAGNRTFAYSNLFGPTAGTGFGVGAESDGGILGWDHSFEWLWMNAYTAGEGIPDIIDPLVSSKFSADFFASDGSVSGLFGQPDMFYYFTDLTQANSVGGSANRAALANVPLIKQGAGSYS